MMHARLMSFRKCILDAVFEQIAATWSSHFKVDVMIKPSSLNDDTRSMLATIPTSKRRKLFELGLDRVLLKFGTVDVKSIFAEIHSKTVSDKVLSTIAHQRAAL